MNYDNLDGGFYTTCNIVPNVKYFMRQNVGYDRYPQIIDGQREAIKNKEIELSKIQNIPYVLYFEEIGTENNPNYINNQLEKFYKKDKIWQ